MISELFKPILFSGTKRVSNTENGVANNLFVRKSDYDKLVALLSSVLPLTEAIPQYADDAAAFAGGAAVGDVYLNTTTGALASRTV